jgi:hypothetical protein
MLRMLKRRNRKQANAEMHLPIFPEQFSDFQIFKFSNRSHELTYYQARKRRNT